MCLQILFSQAFGKEDILLSNSDSIITRVYPIRASFGMLTIWFSLRYRYSTEVLMGSKSGNIVNRLFSRNNNCRG